MSEKTVFNFQVTGETPRGAMPALFSNFLAVSQVGTEVQFEFIFLDLSVLATMIEQMKTAGATVTTQAVDGKSVAKVIMPAAVFVQMKEQFDKVFLALRDVVPKGSEVENERGKSSSNIR